MPPSAHTPLPRLTLVLGGARSGKSAYGEALIEAAGGGVYIATAEALDAEMTARIRAHQARRGAGWMTVEEPLDLAAAIGAQAADRAMLVDCLTLWLSNLMAAGRDPADETATLIGGLSRAPAPVVLVSNEVGQGIVPDNPLARAFADAQGRLNQDMARAAERVVLVTAGLPSVLKNSP